MNRRTEGLAEDRQAAAEQAGLRCCVGALVTDGHGRVFVHRRGWDRTLFPGAWDLVGGHVEPGETLLDALAREVAEETGWAVVGEPRLVHTWDWAPPNDLDAVRREFDFLVEVEGDLDAPRLEYPKHVEGAWVSRDGLDRLDEGRADGDAAIRDVVATGLRHLEG